MFHDLSSGSGVRVSLDYLTQKDGSTHTLLLSENVPPSEAERHNWTEPEPDQVDPGLAESGVGFTWTGTSYESPGVNINQRITEDLPRPASHHPSGVVATFCDGHTVFLAEDIDYYVLVHLMTPSHGVVPGSDGWVPYVYPPGRDILDEGVFE